MRIVLSVLLGMGLTTAALFAHAQPAPVSPLPSTDPPPPAGPAAAEAPSVPPAPPAPGAADTTPIPPPLAPAFAAEAQGEAAPKVALAGWSGGFFIRDPDNYFVLFPSALIQTDFYSFVGPGVSRVPATNGGAGLATRLFLRRARIGLGGEFMKRWLFNAEIEFGGQDLGNVDGREQTSAAPAGVKPTDATGRYAPVDGVASGASPSNIWIMYRFAPWLNITVGQFNVPFSMSNRTADAYNAWMERPLPVRAFAVPSSKDIGVMLSGDVGDGLLLYELGAFGGDGRNRPSVDSNVDFIGRLSLHPFAHGESTFARNVQVGVSGRHGDRDPSSVGYDYTPITTAQGFVLWKPTRTDDQGRQVHVLNSGAQNAIGGELRLRGTNVAFQGEIYYVNNNTREAVDGFQLTNTERLGTLSGLGWYAELSAWPFGSAFIPPEPGNNQPRQLDVEKRERPRRGLQLIGIVGGVNATYKGGSRGDGRVEPTTPSADITVYQYGLGAQYWQTKHVRFALNYILYHTPESGKPAENLAVVPDNLKIGSALPGNGHLLHEFGARLSLSF
jgi:Phosphate-selective porin O and P